MTFVRTVWQESSPVRPWESLPACRLQAPAKQLGPAAAAPELAVAAAAPRPAKRLGPAAAARAAAPTRSWSAESLREAGRGRGDQATGRGARATTDAEQISDSKRPSELLVEDETSMYIIKTWVHDMLEELEKDAGYRLKTVQRIQTEKQHPIYIQWILKMYKIR